MDFAFSEEHDALRVAARDWLRDRYPAERIAQLADGPGHDPSAWAEIGRLGWLDAAQEGFLETAVLLEETGAGLLPAPFFSTVVLALPTGIDPSEATTLAWAEPGAPFIGDEVATRVDAEGRVHGHKVLVPDVAAVSQLVVTTSSGCRLVDMADVTIVERSTIDKTRRLSDVVFDGVPSSALPDLDLTALHTRALAGAACEAVGVAQRTFELATRHVSSREQFGRVIGTYQAVSHQVADMFARLELARSLVYWAAWAVSVDDPLAGQAAAAAKASAGEAAVSNCETAIQVHGGLGFTWDSVLHRYYKRAQWLDSFEGDGRVQRASVAAALLDA